MKLELRIATTDDAQRMVWCALTSDERWSAVGDDPEMALAYLVTELEGAVMMLETKLARAEGVQDAPDKSNEPSDEPDESAGPNDDGAPITVDVPKEEPVFVPE